MPDVSAEIKELEDHFDDDTESIITNERYVYISSIIGECLTKAKKGEKLSTSDKIDRFVTNRFLHFQFCIGYVYRILCIYHNSWCIPYRLDK